MEQNTFIEKYFTPRRHTDSVKWDGLQERFGDDNLLAMWVADMDFRSPDAVTEALLQRAQHGVFGYSQIPEAYFQAFIQWQQQRHRYPVQRTWLRYTPGVVTGLYWLINAFSHPGDAVMVNTPVYYPFLQAIRDCGRTLITSDLVNHQGITAWTSPIWRRRSPLTGYDCLFSAPPQPGGAGLARAGAGAAADAVRTT